MAAKEESPSVEVGETRPVPATDNDNNREERKSGQETFSVDAMEAMFHYFSDKDDDDDDDDDTPIGTSLDSDFDEAEESQYRPMTEAERDIYEQQMKESEGFDIPIFEKDVGYDVIQPVHPGALETVSFYKNLAAEALELLEKQDGNKFELVKVLKANMEFHPPCLLDFYFTLKLKDEAGSENTYRAKIKTEAGEPEIKVLYFAKVSSHECSSGSGNSFNCNPGDPKAVDLISGPSEGNDGSMLQATHKRPFEAISKSED